MNRTLLTAVSACVLLSACAVAPQGQTQPMASAGTVRCDYRVTNAPAKRVDPPSGTDVPATGTASVTLTFASGPVQITLDRADAPCTVHSFESLAQQGFYTDTTCHRAVTAATAKVLQCGDPSGTGSGGPGYWFDDELTHTTTYTTGVVAMANAGPNTNGSQFFIVYGDSSFAPDYTVFGSVDATGVAVIAGIAAQGTDQARSAVDGRPLGDAKITAVTVG